MFVNLLNDNQQRRLGTHVRLLISDLANLADSPELRRDVPGFARVRDSLSTARRAAERLQAALGLPPDKSPGLRRRIAAVAEVWAARLEDLRASRLAAYGAVHPGLAERLDPGLDDVRRRLEALADAAARLPESDG